MNSSSFHRRLLAVDPSLTCSGWALFSVSTGNLLGVGKIRSLSASYAYTHRLNDLQGKIAYVLTNLGLGEQDVLVCESPTTMRDPRAAFKVEQVRGIFETLARERKVAVPGRLNPRSVQREVMGLAGRQIGRTQVKEVAARVVLSLYRSTLEGLGFDVELPQLKKHQDIVDAILVGNLAASRVRTAIGTGVALEQMFEATRRRFSLSGLA